MRIELDPVLRDAVCAAWFAIDGVSHAEPPGFRTEVDAVCAELAERWAGRQPAQIPQLAAARRLYRATGLDPTRHRPSSEALLRRVLQGKGLYALDPVVDTGNLFSLRSGYPLGLYDRDRLQGPVALRLGGVGESYAGIRKGPVNVSGRLCLADAAGAFGSPSSDSARCRVRPETTALLGLLYAPADCDQAALGSAGEELARSFLRWNGGEVVDAGLLPAI